MVRLNLASASPLSAVTDSFNTYARFTCGGDGPPIGEGHHGWLHWVDQPIPANGRPNTDLWPDVSAYEPSELYPVPGLALKDGAPAKVFSSRDPRTVRRHFRWMAEHGVDGAFLQRFVSQVDPEEAGNQDERFGGTRRLRDEVGERVREAAEAEGRVWAIMYDVSGVPASQIQRIVTRDFTHLLRDLRIFSSPAYLRERGKPVVALWGFGLSDSSVSPHTARTVFESVRAVARAVGGEQDVYIFAGVPSHWRTPGTGDAHADPAWEGLWLGETGGGGCAEWAEERWGGDADLIAQHNENLELSGAGRGRKVDYMPVILPGGASTSHKANGRSMGSSATGGKFLWSQIFHAKRLKGVRSFYGAMWDEYDEGTAFLPVVERKRQLPESDRWPFLALDEDGFDLPSDWYMRIAGFAAEGLRSERRIHDSFPSKELQDYWGTRPRYEDEAEPGHGASASGSSSSVRSSAYGSGSTAAANPTPAPAQTENPEEETEAAREARRQFDIWAEEQRQKDLEKEGMPPPAYTLEDDGPAVVEPAAAQQQQPIQQQRPVQPVQQQQPAQSQQPQQHQQTRPVQQQGQQNYSNSRPASLTPRGFRSSRRCPRERICSARAYGEPAAAVAPLASRAASVCVCVRVRFGAGVRKGSEFGAGAPAAASFTATRRFTRVEFGAQL
ncbi:hypothetical protein MSAN_00833500 [Mycena sanguinolenta]|uniref:Xylosidase/arabinosidase n=1 Tax=Mycena sanguinolenta TaxID=230812 RepID=A0A8H6YYU1_9AGAR|nr:hypothetical protein MSAN_00833500 [Mycena sanguinolenta]